MRFILVLLTCSVASVGAPFDLRCDYRMNPLAVEQERPGLSWWIETDQTAYRIQTATAENDLDKASLWDSGWVQSAASTHVTYEGKSVPPVTRVFWRVRIKDGQGNISDWSEPAWFETGLFDEAQWQGAQWISCTRRRSPQMAPKELMGPWIGPEDANLFSQSKQRVYSFDFEIPADPVVYAGAWWAASEDTGIECTINGDGAKFTYRANSRKFTDFAFCLRPGG